MPKNAIETVTKCLTYTCTLIWKVISLEFPRTITSTIPNPSILTRRFSTMINHCTNLLHVHNNHNNNNNTCIVT